MTRAAVAGAWIRPLRQGLCSVAGGCLLTACNFSPPYKPPVVDLPSAYKEDWQPATPADGLPRGAWWEIYRAPTLNELEARVDTANPTLAGASATYQRALDLAAEAGAGLFPTIAANGQLSTNKQSANRPLRGGGEPTFYGANVIGGQASYEIDFWGRVRNAVAAGQDAAEASAADVEGVRLMLHAELAQDYVALRGMDQEAKLLGDTVDSYTRALDLTKALFQGKLASLMDVTRATTQLEDARAQVSEVNARRALFEHAIATLIGLSPAQFSLPPDQASVQVPDVPGGVPAALLERRPDIAAAERRVAAANHGIGIARAAFFPTISLSGSAGFQATNIHLLEVPNQEWAIGPGVSLPIFEGGLLRARLRGAHAAFDAATDAYRATVLQSFREIEDDLAQVHWLRSESEQQRAAADAAQQTLDMSMSLYKNGATSYLDVVTAQTSTLQAQRAVLSLDIRRLQASIGLVRALGGGWSADQIMPIRAQNTTAPATQAPGGE